MYLLDQRPFWLFAVPNRAPRVAAWLAGRNEADLFLNVITLGEIERGINRRSNVTLPSRRSSSVA
ncbi:hypothetical protein [Cereibacter sphaeroides]|uniref:hypothetical protein n=1 Tax=Cereibacter sphaeroides TaxID=1063 RepID=UPI001F24F329|nr:hypothetical protein [Cereibacter sphaeroides]